MSILELAEVVPTIMEGPESWLDNGTEIEYLKINDKKDMIKMNTPH